MKIPIQQLRLTASQTRQKGRKILLRATKSSNIAQKGKSISSHDDKHLIGSLGPIASQTHARVRHIVFLQRFIVQLHGLQEAGLGSGEPVEPHADADVERAHPDGVDVVADGGQDGVEVADALFGFDLDDECGLLVCVFPDWEVGVGDFVAEAGEPAAGWSGTSALVVEAEFSGGDDVLGLFDCVDLGDDDGSSCVKSISDSGVIVTGDSIQLLIYKKLNS